jgi:hypothetical protein
MVARLCPADAGLSQQVFSIVENGLLTTEIALGSSTRVGNENDELCEPAVSSH